MGKLIVRYVRQSGGLTKIEPREIKYSIIIPTIEKNIHTIGHSFEYDAHIISLSAQSPEVKFSEASLKNSIMAVLRLQTFQEVPMPYRLQ